jgi:hypothetical protein
VVEPLQSLSGIIDSLFSEQLPGVDFVDGLGFLDPEVEKAWEMIVGIYKRAFLSRHPEARPEQPSRNPEIKNFAEPTEAQTQTPSFGKARPKNAQPTAASQITPARSSLRKVAPENSQPQAAPQAAFSQIASARSSLRKVAPENSQPQAAPQAAFTRRRIAAQQTAVPNNSLTVDGQYRSKSDEISNMRRLLSEIDRNPKDENLFVEVNKSLQYLGALFRFGVLYPTCKEFWAGSENDQGRDIMFVIGQDDSGKLLKNSREQIDEEFKSIGGHDQKIFAQRKCRSAAEAITKGVVKEEELRKNFQKLMFCTFLNLPIEQ